MNKKVVYSVIGVVLIVITVFGITFAAFNWASDPSGGFINATSECFDLDYTKGEDITDGTLVFGSDYTSGLNATVKAKLSDRCSTMEKGIATLYVDVKDETSAYFMDNDLLRYQVLEDGVAVASGVLTDYGKNAVYSNIEVTGTEKSFTVYVWFSKNDVNDDNLETVSTSTYSVGIQMSAEGR